MARTSPGAVIDSTWYPYALPMVRQLPAPIVEVRCLLDKARAGLERRRSDIRDARRAVARSGLIVLTLSGERICAMTRFENSVFP